MKTKPEKFGKIGKIKIIHNGFANHHSDVLALSDGQNIVYERIKVTTDEFLHNRILDGDLLLIHSDFLNKPEALLKEGYNIARTIEKMKKELGKIRRLI